MGRQKQVITYLLYLPAFRLFPDTHKFTVGSFLFQGTVNPFLTCGFLLKNPLDRPVLCISFWMLTFSPSSTIRMISRLAFSIFASLACLLTSSILSYLFIFFLPSVQTFQDLQRHLMPCLPCLIRQGLVAHFPIVFYIDQAAVAQEPGNRVFPPIIKRQPSLTALHVLQTNFENPLPFVSASEARFFPLTIFV